MKPEMERHIGLIVAETMKVVFFTMSQHISPYIFLICLNILLLSGVTEDMRSDIFLQPNIRL